MARLDELKEASQKAIELINQQEPTFLTLAKVPTAKGQPSYVCPVCGSGSGKNGTGLVKYDNCYMCFSHCAIDINKTAKGYTTESLYFHSHNFLKRDKDYYQSLYDFFNIHPSDFLYQNKSQVKHLPIPKMKPKIDLAQYPNEPKKEPKQDKQAKQDKRKETFLSKFGANYFDVCHSRVAQTDYWSQRGISQATIDRFNLGYDPQYQAQYTSNDGARFWKAIILPTSAYTFSVRRTDYKDFDVIGKNPRASFNLECLATSDMPIFITEGEIDALSIEEAGFPAIGLGGKNNTGNLFAMLKTHPPKYPLILALDNDDKGQEANELIKKELTKQNIDCIIADVNSLYLTLKDANDALLANRNQFIFYLEETSQDAIYWQMEADTRQAEEEAEAEAERQQAIEDYIKTNAQNALPDFISVISDPHRKYIPTGFTELDYALDGGLYTGLYIIGAISSLGKTSFVLQIADQVAQQGNDVIIFSLEIARNKLIAKSISRHTFILSPSAKSKASEDSSLSPHHSEIDSPDRRYPNAQTVKQVLNEGYRKENSYLTPEQKATIDQAIEAYRQYSDHLYIIEGIGTIGTEEIRQTVEKHKDYTGRTPLVIIDYLQIMKRPERGITDKQATDDNVTDLMKLCRDADIPIIAISSFNRENYKQAVSFTSFKESGAIEYSSDVLLGLQLSALKRITKDNPIDLEAEKQKQPREVELVILKNRDGNPGKSLPFYYHSKFNYFDFNYSAQAQEFRYKPIK